MVKKFKKAHNIVYVNCHEAALRLKFNITKESLTEGVIEFKVGWSLLSFGEKFRIIITEMTPSLTKVEVESEAAVKAQVIDWWKNDSNINSFFKTLTETLNR
ncbi:MAG TPA: hypothetical protein VK783_11035 [Bacteroidia bacterium]|jgi:hypothetical protein|nr:hypothetical protein [Bacteroidia bacterium]